MKKSLSLFLAFVMVVMIAMSALPAAVFAADTTGTYTSDAAAIAAGMVFRVGALDTENGNTYATTFAAAFGAAKTSQSCTLYLLKDYTDAAETFGMNAQNAALQNITVDGGNFSLKSTYSGNYHSLGYLTSVTFKNFKSIELVRGFAWNAMDVTFENVQNITAYDRPVLWFQSGNGTLTLKNTTVKETGQEAALRLGIDANGSGNLTLNMVNSTVIHTGSLNGGNEHNRSVIGVSSATAVNINLDASSKLEMAYTGGNAGNSTACIVATNPTVKPALTITLAEGAQLIQSGIGTNGSFMITQSGTVLQDNGTKFVIKASAANGNVNFPNIGDDKAFVAADDTTVISGGTYTKTAAQTTDMIFTAVTKASAWTDASATAAGYRFRVGTVDAQKYYAKLADAVTYAKSNPATVYLLADYSTTELITVDGACDIVIEGQNHTITKTGGDNYFMIAKNGAKVTFQNTTLALLGGFISNGNGSFVIKNCTATTAKRPLWKNSSGSNNSMVFDNVQATNQAVTGDGQNMILSEYAASGTLTVKNGSVLKEQIQSGTTNLNNSLIMINASSVLNVTVESGCELVNAVTANGNNKFSAIVVIASSNASTLTLENGSKLSVSATALSNPHVFIYRHDNNQNLTVTDKGCIYKVAAATNKLADVSLPTVTTVNGKAFLAFSNGTAMVGATLAKNADATADTVLTAVGYNASQFTLLSGASIRTAAPYGIRFAAQMDKTLYEQLVAADANVEFGIVLGAKRYIFGEGFFTNLADQNTKNYAKVVCENMNDVGNYKQFAAAVYIAGDENLANAGKTQFETQMTACAYFTIHFADGTTQTIWTAYDATANTRSIFDVAKAYYEDASITDGSNKNNATINKILTDCGYSVN